MVIFCMRKRGAQAAAEHPTMVRQSFSYGRDFVVFIYYLLLHVLNPAPKNIYTTYIIYIYIGWQQPRSLTNTLSWRRALTGARRFVWQIVWKWIFKKGIYDGWMFICRVLHPTSVSAVHTYTATVYCRVYTNNSVPPSCPYVHDLRYYSDFKRSSPKTTQKLL